MCRAHGAYLFVCVYPLHARFARGMLSFVNNSRHRTLTAGWLEAPRHVEKKTEPASVLPFFPGIF